MRRSAFFCSCCFCFFLVLPLLASQCVNLFLEPYAAGPWTVARVVRGLTRLGRPVALLWCANVCLSARPAWMSLHLRLAGVRAHEELLWPLSEAQ